jgi:predicted exporter
VLASATTLALLSLFGVQPNLLHVVSLLLVLSMGEDYAIFLVASKGDELRASCISVVLCCLATALGFGLLGLSNIPALQAIGLTTGIGVFVSFLLAPVALAIMPYRSPA